MKTINKIQINNESEVMEIRTIQLLIDKINELTEKVNELNFEVATIHEWKIDKEGI